MKLIVDASIAVKWFFTESHTAEARRLLAHRIVLHAPDLILTEAANVIWKKARRKEIPDAQPYLAELDALRDVVTLRQSKILTKEDRDIYLDTPAWRRLVGLLTELSCDERIDLMALGWLGRESGSWTSFLEHAYKMGIDDPHYEAGLGRYWQEGFDRLHKAQRA